MVGGGGLSCAIIREQNTQTVGVTVNRCDDVECNGSGKKVK